jgi:hypothetical protein
MDYLRPRGYLDAESAAKPRRPGNARLCNFAQRGATNSPYSGAYDPQSSLP